MDSERKIGIEFQKRIWTDKKTNLNQKWALLTTEVKQIIKKVLPSKGVFNQLRQPSNFFAPSSEKFLGMIKRGLEAWTR